MVDKYMENVLVTGGAGFIGSWLCENLVDEYNVICVDNFITGKSDNVSHLLKRKNFTLIKHDVSKPLTYDNDIQYVFHLSSPASPVDYQRFSIETMLVNSLGTYNMLNLAKDEHARFLLASTSEVYGDPLEHPQKEEYWGNVNPVGPRSCYDESKRFAEALAMAYNRREKLDIRIARIFNTYGPMMRIDDERVIPNFIKQSLHNKPITVYGDGKQTRSFCYISDMVDGLRKLMFSNTPEKIFNLGNPQEFTVLELANLVKRLTQSDSKIVFVNLPEDDPSKRKPDISKAKKYLGWYPKVKLDDGLKHTVRAFNKN
jgi:dTDP-glucose 4,6-dehydratase